MEFSGLSFWIIPSINPFRRYFPAGSISSNWMDRLYLHRSSPPETVLKKQTTLPTKGVSPLKETWNVMTTFRSTWFIWEIVSEHSRLFASRKERKSGVDSAYSQYSGLLSGENVHFRFTGGHVFLVVCVNCLYVICNFHFCHFMHYSISSPHNSTSVGACLIWYPIHKMTGIYRTVSGIHTVIIHFLRLFVGAGWYSVRHPFRSYKPNSRSLTFLAALWKDLSRLFPGISR